MNIVLRKDILFWGVIILIWAGVIIGTLWSKGYQHQSSRSFTDKEMLRIAVQRAMQSMQANPPKIIAILKKNNFGYCLQEERYLSTQEKFNIVVAGIINEEISSGGYSYLIRGKRWLCRAYSVNDAGGKVFTGENLETFHYFSLEEFYVLNPNCC